MSAKSLEDILIEVPTGALDFTGFNIGPKLQRRIPDRSKFDYREISGKAWSETLGRFVSKHQIIDRGNNRYFELVVDDETGEVLNSCEESLSTHSGHGSAKYANRD